MPVPMTYLGCSLVLAGFAAGRFAERRRLGAGCPAPLDTLALLAVGLSAVGLAVMATLAA